MLTEAIPPAAGAACRGRGGSCEAPRMLDATGKKLVRLLRPEHPAEMRCAAALVLGEVGARDAEVIEAVCEGLEDADAAFRLQATIAAGKLRIEPALPRLLERVTAGGPEA